MGEDDDPGVSLPVALIRMFMTLALNLSKQRMLLQAAWQSKLNKLRSPNRWLSVSTHVDAVIASLLNNLWVPTGPFEWTD